MSRVADLLSRLKHAVSDTKVAANYLYLSLTSVGGLLIGLFLYSYTVRTLGAERFGLFVFCNSIVMYLSHIVVYGFVTPSIKRVVDCGEDAARLSDVASTIFSAKILLFFLTVLIFAPFLFFLPVLSSYKVLFALLLMQLLGEMMNFGWYFQGRQRMEVNTAITLSVRIASIPAVLLWVKSPDDLLPYALIYSLTVLLVGLSQMVALWVMERMRLRLVSWRKIWNALRMDAPFFFALSLEKLKESALPVLVGSFLGMGEVALYNIADKIMGILRTLLDNINLALYPEFVDRASRKIVRRIFKNELVIGLAVMAAVALLGYWAVWLIGGRAMLPAYPLTVVLSVCLLSNLMVGASINFVFVPNGCLYKVTKRQFISVVVAVVLCYVGLRLCPDVLVAVSAVAFASLCEMAYCLCAARRVMRGGVG